MKRKTVALILVFICSISSISLNAQEQTNNKQEELSRKLNFGLGVDINQTQNDFGCGLNFTSPYFYHRAFAVRLKVGINSLEATLIGNSSEGSYIYNINRLGILRRWSIIENKIETYTELGLCFLFPNKDFSDKNFGFGGFWVWGLECFPSAIIPVCNLAFFWELGFMGINVKADKTLQNSTYSDGFAASVGFRYYF